MASGWALVALAVSAVATGACAGGQPKPPAEAAAAGPIAGGHWQRTGGAPRSVRGLQELEAVRAAGKVVVVGGVDYDQTYLKALVLDPHAARWSRAAPSRLWWRFGHSALAAGDELIVWGGCCGPAGRGRRAAGAAYAIGRDVWRVIDPGPLAGRFRHTAVWTGTEMIIWGGFDGDRLRRDGAAYDPRSDRWRRIAPAPLSARHYHVAVWTGTEMVVWGGSRPAGVERERMLPDGAAYDPERDRWRSLPPAPLRPAPVRLGAGVEAELDGVWTGDGVIVWNGVRGAIYHPAGDSWERLPPPPPSLRHWKPADSAIWSGAELIVWGGTARHDSSDFVAAGATYDPERRRWRLLPEAPIAGRDRHAAVWTGDAMLVWGGCCRRGRYHSDGALYRPR